MTMFSLRFLTTALLALASATSAFAADEIKLLGTRSNECPPVSGCYATQFFEATVEVKNLAYAKQIGIRYRKDDGTWATAAAPAQTPYTLPSGNELWKVTLPAPVTAYAFYYTVNGQTYWDNNNGANYASAHYRYDGQLTSQSIGYAQGYWQAPTSGNTAGGTLHGDILVKNVGPTKSVKVIYTEDNWATVKNGQAAFNFTLASGFEDWIFSVPTAPNVDQSKVQVAFELNYNGQTLWDNNFGRNYKLVNGKIVR